MTVSRSRVGVGAALLAAIVSVVAVAAAQAAPSQRAALPDLAYAQAQVDKFHAVPRWKSPGAAIDASKAKGKTIFIVPIFSALPYQQLLNGGVKAAAKAVGITVKEQTNQGSPAQWAQGVEQAIAQKADLIALIGAPDPRLIQPQLKKAKAAGIPVVVGNLVNEGTPAFDNVSARMDMASQATQRVAADYTIAYTKGTANTLIITANEVNPSKGLVAAIEDEYAKVCGPGCKTTVVNVPLAQWSTKMQSTVQAALTADPKITFVHPIYDGMTTFAVAGIKAAGALDRVKLGTVDGSDFVLKMIQQKADKGLVLFDIGYSLDWHGWADMDVILRILLGQPAPATQNLPRRIFDASNIGATGTPPSPLKGYGATYIAGYSKLWGLTK